MRRVNVCEYVCGGVTLCGRIGRKWYGLEYVLDSVVLCVDWLLFWAFSSDGRAPASHAGGSGIDTRNVHFVLLLSDIFLCYCASLNVHVLTTSRTGGWLYPILLSYTRSACNPSVPQNGVVR